MYKICVFVPLESSQTVKNAMFSAGGGRIGLYDCCSFETKGTGQFRPLPGSNPAIGSVQNLTYVEELKIEMVASDEYIKDVVEAMKKAHPYEMPAYDVIRLVEI